MMDIAQLVSSVFSQMMKEAKLYILIQKKLWLEMRPVHIIRARVVTVFHAHRLYSAQGVWTESVPRRGY